MNSLLDLVPERATPAERFPAWLADNRHIYNLFCRYAREVRDAGHRKFSADAIVHRIRWHLSVETKPLPGDPEFKLNNDYCAHLARTLVADDPTFADFFEFRKVKA
jgi:hypothetical protein